MPGGTKDCVTEHLQEQGGYARGAAASAPHPYSPRYEPSPRCFIDARGPGSVRWHFRGGVGIYATGAGAGAGAVCLRPPSFPSATRVPRTSITARQASSAVMSLTSYGGAT